MTYFKILYNALWSTMISEGVLGFTTLART